MCLCVLVPVSHKFHHISVIFFNNLHSNLATIHNFHPSLTFIQTFFKYYIWYIRQTTAFDLSSSSGFKQSLIMVPYIFWCYLTCLNYLLYALNRLNCNQLFIFIKFETGPGVPINLFSIMSIPKRVYSQTGMF